VRAIAVRDSLRFVCQLTVAGVALAFCASCVVHAPDTDKQDAAANVTDDAGSQGSVGATVAIASIASTVHPTYHFDRGAHDRPHGADALA